MQVHAAHLKNWQSQTWYVRFGSSVNGSAIRNKNWQKDVPRLLTGSTSSIEEPSLSVPLSDLLALLLLVSRACQSSRENGVGSSRGNITRNGGGNTTRHGRGNTTRHGRGNMAGRRRGQTAWGCRDGGQE